MKNFTTTRSIRNFFILIFILSFYCGSSQTTVFSDDFTTSAGTNYTSVNGVIGTSTKWNMSRSGSDFGAKIDLGYMTLVNDASTSSNVNGWVMAYTNAATSFATPYSTTLNSNPGLVTWTFNMRQIKTNPSGFSSSSYGNAYILAGTSGTTSTSGTGYAVVLGTSSSSTDPIKLVRYTAGIKTSSTLITSNTSGLTDFGAEYVSVKVTYTPSTNTWQLYLRKDGTTAFQDPTTGTLTSQGTVVNSTYTASSLPIMGYFWNASTTAAQTAFLDNVTVSVAVPSITSVTPSSKIAGTGAFTLTVNGADFVSGISTVKWNGSNRTTTFVSSTQLTAAILATDITSSGTAAITVANGLGVSNSDPFVIDVAGIPTLNVSSSSLNPFSTITGTASSAATYTISGSNLTADAVVTAPTNFEVSTDGSTYSTSVTLTKTGNVLVGDPVTIYARVKASAAFGLYNGTITNTTTGGTTKNVSVSAVVLATQPTTASSNITFTNVTSESFKVNWTNGNGSKHLVLIHASSAVNSNPIDAISYSAMTTYGTGTELGTGNFTVYNGTGTNVLVTGLSATTTYYVAIYELNGSSGTENYNTTSFATANRTTLNSPVGWQIYTTNTISTIDFDTTEDGVNDGAFQGDGFAPNSATGLLNSNAWSISGFTDGSIAFGGTSTDGQDFDRGPSTGDETVGGIYGFETSTNNFSLGIHPATGDFAPGAITLRFQNQTGTTITSLSLGYKVYVYNGQDASNSLAFSHSSNNSSYTSISGINCITPTTADTSGWTSYYRVVTITGLSLTNNNYYYLRWSGATVSGSSQFDDISLDDITLVANPTTTFASFEGTAKDFIVQGNTSLSNDTSVTSNLTINSGKVSINGNTLTLGGTITNTVTEGLVGCSTCNITMNGSANATLSLDQTTLGTTNLLNNLTINTNSSNTISISNPIVINGALNTSVGQTLDLGTLALTGTLSSITNNGTIKTQNTSSLPIPSGKTWGGTGNVHYNATSTTQNIVAGTYSGLTIATTGGGDAVGDLTVNGILYLPNSNPSATNGMLDMGSYTLTMGLSATNTGLGDVTGTITRNNPLTNTVYTFGNPKTTFTLTGVGDAPTYITIIPTIGVSSCCENPAPDPAPILRHYEILFPITSPGLYTSANLHYLDSELNGNNENEITTADYDIPTPIELGGSGKGWTSHDEHGRAQYDITTTGYKYVGFANVPISYFIYVPGQTGDPGYPHDWRTIFSLYTHSNSAYKEWKGTEDTNWNNGANWLPQGAVDTTSRIIIPDASELTNLPVFPSGDITLQSITIGSNVPLTALGDITITATGVMGGGAWEDVNGSFIPNSHKVTFTGIGATITGTTQFYDVEINDEASIINMEGSIMKISNTITKNGTGEWYPALFNTTVDYNGSNQTVVETGSSSYYHNLILSGSGTKTLPSSSMAIDGTLTFANTATATAASILSIKDGLIIEDGASFNAGAYNHTIGGNFDNSGTFTATSGHTITMNGDKPQLIKGSTPTSFNNLTINNTHGVTILTNTDVNNTLTLTDGNLFITDATLGINGTISKTLGTIYPYASASLRFGGTDNLVLADDLFGNTPSLNNLTINRVGGLELGNQSIQITNILNLIDGTLNLNSSNLTIGGSGSISITSPSASNMIIANDSGELRKTFTTNGAYTFPIGDATDTAEYSPITIDVTGTAYSEAYIGVNVSNTKHPNNSSPTNYLNRYWNISQSGITACTVAITAQYTNNDITGTEATISSAKYDGDFNPDSNPWIRYSDLDNNTLTISGENVTLGQHSVITGITKDNPTVSITSSNFSTCLGSNYSLETTHTADSSVLYSWSPSDFLDDTTIANPTITNITETTTYTVTIKDANGMTASAEITITTGGVTTWTGTWDNGEPTSTSAVVFSSNYTATGDLTVCSITVNNGAVVLIPSGMNVNLYGALTVTSGSFVLKNNANLFQSTDVENSGNIIVKRNSSALKRLDYTLWSSPVNGQELFSFSPLTLENRFYTYNPVDNFYNTIISTSDFEIAKGYLIRMPYNHPTSASIWNGVFTGTPHNGNYSYAMYVGDATHRFNLVGNPYPSPISISTFVADNSSNITGTLYFWRKTNNAASPSYCSWLDDTFVDNGETEVINPNGIIRTGQGFFVEAMENATTVNFNNAQRVADNSDQFFKNNAINQKNRIWLNATNSSGAFSQTEVGYVPNASQGLDNHDGKYINDGAIEFYSIINSEKLVIQSRALPFDSSDIVPLGFKTVTADTYTITIDHLDGLFLGDQDILLKDKLTGTIHDLKASGYTFASEIGTFNERFELIYSNLLSVPTTTFNNNQVIVYKKSDDLIINSGTIVMDYVRIFDARGRLIMEKKDIGNNTTSIPIGTTNELFIIQINDINGTVVMKKIIN
jgi:hypothetical protein